MPRYQGAPLLTKSDDFPSNLQEQFDRSYGAIAYGLSRFLVRHMRRVLVELQMDLESAFLLGTLAQLNVAARLAPGQPLEKILDEAGMIYDDELTPARLADLSQVTGLPRETVRRKLKKLRETGKVVRAEDGGWKVRDAYVDEETRSFTQESVKMLLATAIEIQALLCPSSK